VTTERRAPRAFAEDLLPDELLLAVQRPSRPMVLLLASILILLAGFGVLARFLSVDRLVIARGMLRTAVAPTSIRPLETTTVKQILVVPGQRVHAGQMLVRFDKNLNEDAIAALIIRPAV